MRLASSLPSLSAFDWDMLNGEEAAYTKNF